MRGSEEERCVLGVVHVKDDSSSESPVPSLEVHLDACVKVARGKFGPDVEIIVYVNKKISVGEDSSLKDLPVSLQTESFTVLSSSPRLTSRTCYEGGVVLSSPATGCSLCITPFTLDTPQEEHIKTDSHQRNYLFSMYKRDRDQLLTTPHSLGLDLSIATSDPDVRIIEDGVVEIITKPGEVKNFKIVLKNNLPTTGQPELDEKSSLVVEDVGPLQPDSHIDLTDEHQLCEKEETKIRLKPGKKYKISVKFTPAEIGQSKVPVMVAFYHEFNSPMLEDRHRLSRMALELLFKVQTDDITSMMPAAPYVHKEVSTLWRVRETIKGLPLTKHDSQDALEQRLPLAPSYVSERRKKVIASRLEKVPNYKEDQVEYKKCKDLMRSGLSQENYSLYWQFLLDCERFQEEKDIRVFDMVNKVFKIDRMSGLFVLEVPGLAENRPSVLKGDRLYAKEHGPTSRPVEYEGIVHVVNEQTVHLGFSTKFTERVRAGMTWDIRFSFSPFTYDNMHRAVKLASSLNKFLFPSAAFIPHNQGKNSRSCSSEIFLLYSIICR